MKRYMIAVAVLAFASTMAWSQEGATLFKSKCAMCHGPEGQGKIGPSLKGKSAAEVEAVLTKGGKPKAPHTKAFSGVTADQAKAIGDYVATLK